MSDQAAAYVAGICNINREEIARRRKAGHFGLGLTVVVAIALFVLTGDRWIRLVLFAPVFIAAIGYLQAKNKFCVSYAASGLQNATEGSKKAQTVEEPAHAIDKAKARKLNVRAALIALLVTAVVVAI